MGLTVAKAIPVRGRERRGVGLLRERGKRGGREISVSEWKR